MSFHSLGLEFKPSLRVDRQSIAPPKSRQAAVFDSGKFFTKFLRSIWVSGCYYIGRLRGWHRLPACDCDCDADRDWRRIHPLFNGLPLNTQGLLPEKNFSRADDVLANPWPKSVQNPNQLPGVAARRNRLVVAELDPTVRGPKLGRMRQGKRKPELAPKREPRKSRLAGRLTIQRFVFNA